MRSVDGFGAESISVVVIRIWLWIRTWIIFWAEGVGRRRVRLLYTSVRIRLPVVIRVRSVIRSVCLRDTFWAIPSYGCRSALHFISCVFRSYCDFGWIRCYPIILIAIKGWLFMFTLPCSSVQNIKFNDNFRVWLHSRGVIGMSGIGWSDVSWCSLIRWSSCVLLVPILRTK